MDLVQNCTLDLRCSAFDIELCLMMTWLNGSEPDLFDVCVSYNFLVISHLFLTLRIPPDNIQYVTNIPLPSTHSPSLPRAQGTVILAAVLARGLVPDQKK